MPVARSKTKTRIVITTIIPEAITPSQTIITNMCKRSDKHADTKGKEGWLNIALKAHHAPRTRLGLNKKFKKGRLILTTGDVIRPIGGMPSMSWSTAWERAMRSLQEMLRLSQSRNDRNIEGKLSSVFRIIEYSLFSCHASRLCYTSPSAHHHHIWHY